MVFSSLTFLFAFLPAVLLTYFLIPQRCRSLRNGVLLIFSLFFYVYGEPVGIFVMLASILANTLLAIGISRYSERVRKLLLALAVVMNIGLLVFFKYTGFAVSNLNRLFGLSLTVPAIVMPIGISFFTFQGMSYVLDVYRSRCAPQKNILNVATYIALFPQLVAGPIVRYETVADELLHRRETAEEFVAGCRRLIIGLGRKMLIGNALGEAASAVFGSDLSAVSTGAAWFGAIAYALHIYFDFSGYSDMAIGLGQMFGFHFPENFNHPYLAASVSDFWRRWHISLSTWFRDYVYIPLGGNRCGRVRQLFNLLIVWLLTGLWHGASWNFVLWGLYYAVLLILERLFFARLLDRLPTVFRHLYTMLAVLIGWVLFNAGSLSQVVAYLQAMFGIHVGGAGAPSLRFLFGQYHLELLLGMLFCLPLPRRFRAAYQAHTWLAILCDGLLLMIFGLSVVSITVSSFNPFIYFRF